MNAKRMLSQVGHTDKEAELLIDALARSKSQLTAARAATLSDMPKGGQPMELSDAIDSHHKLEAKVNKIIARLCREKLEAIEAIFLIEDSILRQVLEMRYMTLMEWDDIREAMGYQEIKSVYNLHGRALKQIEDKIH